MKAHRAKIQGNERPQGQNARKWRPRRLKTAKWSRNARKWRPTRPKCKEMKAQGQNARKWRPTRPKCKEMKAHKAKMQGNEGPQGQNERKWRRTKPKCKEMQAHKPKNWKIDSATAPINSLYGTLGKRTVFGNLWGGPTGKAATRRNAI